MVAKLARSAIRPATPWHAMTLLPARLIVSVRSLIGLRAVRSVVEAPNQLGSCSTKLPSTVARHVNMDNLKKSQRIATPKHAQKGALVHLARGVHAMPLALVVRSLAPSVSSDLQLVEVLNALTQTVKFRQLHATNTIAQRVMFALRCKHARMRMALFSDDDGDTDALRL